MGQYEKKLYNFYDSHVNHITFITESKIDNCFNQRTLFLLSHSYQLTTIFPQLTPKIRFSEIYS
jgi:hypothetical protein